MKTKINLITFFAVCLFFSACVSKEAPSEVGELMTAEQIMNLPSDDSFNQKFVAVDAYWNFSKMLIKSGTRNNIQLSTEPMGKGQKLVVARILVENGDKKSTPIYGTAARNQITVFAPIDAETCKVIADDYTEVGYQKMRFSGTLIYENGEYKLDNVTLHKL